MKAKNTHTTVGARVGGKLKTRILNADGSIEYESDDTHNLVMYAGIADKISGAQFGTWASVATNAMAGTDSTPNFTTPAGTYSQSGTTVTRETGSVDFVAGDVGATIKFSTGEESYITSVTNTTTVEVRETHTVAATTIVLWRTNQTALGAYVVGTYTKTGSFDTNDYVDASTTITFIHTFPIETVAQAYNEIGYAYSDNGGDDLFSRIVLPSTLNVDAGQQLQTEYVLTFGFDGQYGTTGTHPITQEITGWPYPYELNSITHSGTDFTATFTKDHHYEIGDTINISNAVMPEVAVTSISSDSSEFTVITSADHLLDVGDSVVIAGSSVTGYNGSWTVASITNTTTFVVTDTNNFGAATGGTVRETPFPYFNGQWVINSIPTSDSITVLDATIDSVATDAVFGDLKGDLSADAVFEGEQIVSYPYNQGDTYMGIFDHVAKASYWRLGIYTTAGQPDLGGMSNGAEVQAPQVNATQDLTLIQDIDNHAWGYEATFTIAEANSDEIRGFAFYNPSGRSNDVLGLAVRYHQKQRKDAGYSLKMGLLFTMRPELVD